MGRYSNQDVILLRLRALLALPPPSGDVRSSVVGRKVKQRQRRLRVGEVDDLIAGYEAGTKIDDLANKFGIHRATVHEHLNRRGIDRRPSPGLAPDQIVQAAIYYTDGESLLTVAGRFGVDAETIRMRLRDAGVEIRPTRGWEGRRSRCGYLSSEEKQNGPPTSRTARPPRRPSEPTPGGLARRGFPFNLDFNVRPRLKRQVHSPTLSD